MRDSSQPFWLAPRFLGPVLLLLTAWCFSAGALAQTLDPCGAPAYNASSDSGIYLWEENCGNATRTFSLQALAGAHTTTLVYDGRIDASEALSALTPVSLESNDLLELADGNLRLNYRLNVGRPWNDGFRVSAPSGASLCFGANLPAGTQVNVGPNATPVTAPFDLTTFESCAVVDPPICGAPTYSDTADTALYLWEDNCGGATRTFFVRALAGGSPSVLTYSGLVESNLEFGAATAYSLESNDSLALAEGNQRIEYRLNVASGWYDSFSFTAPKEANVCFGANLPAGTQVRVGQAGTPVTVPFDLTTLESCAEEQPVVCGAPSYNAATDRGIYVWEENCGGSSHAFSVMALAGGMTGTQVFAGKVEAGQALQGMTPISLESNDLLELVENDQRINYRLNVGSPWFDGFRFTAPGETSLCFGADLPAGTQVFVGRDAVAVTAPFDLLTLASCAAPPPPPPTGDQMNIVVILTDDQRWDTLSSTPNIEALASEGVRFSNAFVSYPVCGPVRASLLSGGFRAANTGIISNNNSIAPFESYNDRDTLAVRLQQAGYKTLYVGKYLNGYPSRKTYVPPGWTRWMANNQGETLGWTNFTVTEGSSTTEPSVGTSVGPIPQYVTDFHRDEVLSFLDNAGNSPFFIFWAPFAPHAPATPAEGDETLFSDYEYRDRAWGETDLSDKPSWVTNPSRFPEAKAPDDEFHRNQLRSLQALDRGVDDIVAKVNAMGLADKTIFFVLSDNGYQWGEHGLSGKGVPYEESLRVPFVVFGAGIDSSQEDRMVLADLDLGPTIMEIAGVTAPASDGTSLKPLLDGEEPEWRDRFLVESWGNGASGPYCTWAALRTEQWKYVLQASGEEELYDLASDPYEEESLHLDPVFDFVKEDLANQLLAEKSLAFNVLWAAAGRVGVAYSQPLTAWGGSGDYQWTLETGQLPPGLTLNPETGIISGTPTLAGTYAATIRVEDGTVGTHSGQPRQHRNEYRITIR